MLRIFYLQQNIFQITLPPTKPIQAPKRKNKNKNVQSPKEKQEMNTKATQAIKVPVSPRKIV